MSKVTSWKISFFFGKGPGKGYLRLAIVWGPIDSLLYGLSQWVDSREHGYRKALFLHSKCRSFLHILTLTNSGTVFSGLVMWKAVFPRTPGLSKPHFSDATGLPKADRTGHSDPYVVVQARQQNLQSGDDADLWGWLEGDIPSGNEIWQLNIPHL